MKLHVVSMVRDEEDVIETFVRHNLAYVDEIRIVAHRSTDNTLPILESLAREGLPLRVTTSHDTAFRQGATLSALAREAFAAGADYVLPIDADEFLRLPSRAALEQVLPAVPAGANAALAWQTYVPTPTDNDDEVDVLVRTPFRLARETMPLGKLVLGRAFAHDASQRLLEGAHGVFHEKAGKLASLPIHLVQGGWLAHYPVRSLGQCVTKLLQRRWQRRIAWVDEPISRLVAAGTRSMFDRMAEIVLEHGTLTREQLAWLAVAYSDPHQPGDAPPFEDFRGRLVRDPCPSRAGEHRYGDRRNPAPLALFRWIDSLVSERAIGAANAGRQQDWNAYGRVLKVSVPGGNGGDR